MLGWGPCAELIRAIRVDLRCEQSFEDEVSIQWMPGGREFHAEGPARVNGPETGQCLRSVRSSKEGGVTGLTEGQGRGKGIQGEPDGDQMGRGHGPPSKL